MLAFYWQGLDLAEPACLTRTFSSMKNGSPDTFSNFLSGKSGWRSGMKQLTLFFLETRQQQMDTVRSERVGTGSEESECSASTPCDRELDEVQQLLGTVANRTGLVAVSTATDTPGETNMESPGEQSGWETKGPEPEKNWNQNRTRTKTRITAGTRARTKPEPEPQLNNQNYNKNRIRTESEQNSLLSLFQLLVLVLHQQMIPAEVRPALSSWWRGLACSVVMVMWNLNSTVWAKPLSRTLKRKKAFSPAAAPPMTGSAAFFSGPPITVAEAAAFLRNKERDGVC